jgi:hypothetical protein
MRALSHTTRGPFADALIVTGLGPHGVEPRPATTYAVDQTMGARQLRIKVILTSSSRLVSLSARTVLCATVALLAACGGGAGEAVPRTVSVRVYQGESVSVSTSTGQTIALSCGHAGTIVEPAGFDQLWTVTIRTIDGRQRLAQFSVQGDSIPPGGPSQTDNVAEGAEIIHIFAFALDNRPLPSRVPMNGVTPPYAKCGTSP